MTIWGKLPLQSGVWYHIAAVKAGSGLRLFINGVPSVGYGGPLYYNLVLLGPPLRFGGPTPTNPEGTEGIDGRMEEIRIINGLAVWNREFTPPTGPHTG